ncbi:MAG: N-acetyltransferase [Bacteroidetes bacterium]|nr:MAG: N-acetyltransferase [Bacteroidota bacterium]
MLTLNFSPFPEIGSKRLHLRHIEKSDAAEVLYLRGNAHVMKFIDKPLQKTTEDAIAHIDLIENGIQKNNSINWGICLRPDSKLLGIIGYHIIDKTNYRAEIGYILHDAYWGKGITNEAIQLVVNFAFDKMNLHSIEARINPDHIASRNILIKNHFEKEAYFRENFHANGKFLDTEVYSLIKSRI